MPGLRGINYDPVALFCVLMYGLMRGERATRRLEELCAYDCRFWHLTGNSRLDHSTIWRFRHALDVEETLPLLMLSVIQAATNLGLVQTGVWVADGTKIATSSSQWRKLLGEAESLETAQSAETIDGKPERAKAFRASSDPDARTMVTTHGEYLEGYNLQIAVEASSGIVMGALATSDANDSKALGPLLRAASKQSGCTPEELVADKGYETPVNLQVLETANVKSCLCPKERKNAPFTPDESGVMRCLAGHEASCSRTTKGGVPYDVYRVSKCKDCPLRQACGAKRRQREMAVMADADDEDRGATVRRRTQNAQYCRSEEGKAKAEDPGPNRRVNLRIHETRSGT